MFSWDAMAPPPAGGYVLEGGFAAGQTAGALAVGNATSVALPMPAGPLFIRVRPQGSSEVSNEIVAGCRHIYVARACDHQRRQRRAVA